MIDQKHELGQLAQFIGSRCRVNQEQFERALQELKASQEVLGPSDVVLFSEPMRSVLTQALRIGRISLGDLARQLDLERAHAQQIVRILVERRLFQISSFTNPAESFFETRLSASTRPLARLRSDLRKKIDD